MRGLRRNGVAFSWVTNSRNRAASDCFTPPRPVPWPTQFGFHLFSRRGVMRCPPPTAWTGGDGRPRRGCRRRSRTLAISSSSNLTPGRRRRAPAGGPASYDSPKSVRRLHRVELDLEVPTKVNKLIDVLEDSDDVQNICTSMSLSDEVRAWKSRSDNERFDR